MPIYERARPKINFAFEGRFQIGESPWKPVFALHIFRIQLARYTSTPRVVNIRNRDNYVRVKFPREYLLVNNCEYSSREIGVLNDFEIIGVFFFYKLYVFYN